MIKILKDYEMGKVDFIFHFSDIHIRLYSRHDEYILVFEKVYKKLKEYHLQKKNCISVLTGDILHSKTDLSPEVEKVTYDFLRNLSEFFPIFIIAGNHDGLIHNPDRMDSLSSILYEREIDNCFYLKETGIYEFQNIRFFVDALFDEEDIDMSQEMVQNFASGYKNIGLFHGQIKGWRNLKGFVSPTGEKYVEEFSGMDYVLLGDIHCHQYMSRRKPIMAYASSLISQNFNEYDLNHGFLVWNLNGDVQEYIIMENEYRHQIIEILPENRFMTDGNEYTFLEDMDNAVAPYGRIKVLGNEDEISSREHFLKLKNRFPNACFSFEVRKLKESFREDMEDVNQDAVFSEYDIILSYIKNNCSEENREEFSKYILKLFHENQPSSNNVQYKLKEVSFSNMFGYGEENYIDLSKYHKSTIGIFGPNTFGKSTIIDIISILLYDKIARYSHGVGIPKEVIHFREKQAWGKLVLSFGAKEYIIQKEYTRNSTNQKINLKSKLFIQEKGETKELTGEQRRVTNKVMNDMLGSFENFMFFNAYLQQKELSFREMTSLNKKKFLNSIYGNDFLEGFEKKHKDDLKSKEIEYRLYEDQQKKHGGKDYQQIIQTVHDELSSIKESIDKTKKSIEEYESKINSMNQQLSTTYSEEDMKFGKETESFCDEKLQGMVDTLSSLTIQYDTLQKMEKEILEMDYKENITVFAKDDLFQKFSSKKHLGSCQNEFYELYSNVQKYKMIGVEKIDIKLKKYYSRLMEEDKHNFDINMEKINSFPMEDKILLQDKFETLSQEIGDFPQKIKERYNAMHHTFDKISESNKEKEGKALLKKIKTLQHEIQQINEKMKRYENYLRFKSEINLDYYRENYERYHESEQFLSFSPFIGGNSFEKWKAYKQKHIPEDLNYEAIHEKINLLEKKLNSLRSDLQEVSFDKNLKMEEDREIIKKKQKDILDKYRNGRNTFEFSDKIKQQINSILSQIEIMERFQNKIDFLQENLESCKNVEVNLSCNVCVKNKWYLKKLEINKQIEQVQHDLHTTQKDIEERTMRMKTKDFQSYYDKDSHIATYMDGKCTLSQFLREKENYIHQKEKALTLYHHHQKVLENDAERQKFTMISKNISKYVEKKKLEEKKLKRILEYSILKNVYTFLDYQWEHQNTFDFDITLYLSKDCKYDEDYHQLKSKQSELMESLKQVEKQKKDVLQIWKKDLKYKEEIVGFEKKLQFHHEMSTWFVEVEKLDKKEKNETYKKEIQDLEKKKKFVLLYENKKTVLDFLQVCFRSESWKQNPETDFRQQINKLFQDTQEISNKIDLMKLKKKNYLHDIEILKKIGEYKNIKQNLKSFLEELDLKRGTLLSKYEEIQINQTLWEENRKNLYSISTEIKKEKELISILEKDGLPLHLLKQKLSLVESKINEMIRPFSSKYVSFSISNDKNSIDFGFTNSNNNVICSFISGMEAFILDICLKFCLSYFYIRPKSNIFIIDEKVSVLDKQKLSNITSLFEFLKTTSTNILIISHIEIIKDYVDTSMEIKKINEKSHLTFK